MKVFVTGVCGQLGFDVAHELIRRGHRVIGSDILEEGESIAPYVKLDITDEKAVEQAIADNRPDAVIHCAAWTAVDAAEERENIPKVRAINADGTRHIAQACKKADCKLMYISTDYVFDGLGTTPWEPDCEAYAPLNVYGQTKLEGELAVREALEKYFIVRISWVFGPHGNNFVKTMLRLSENHDVLRVVKDQIGTPTYTPDLAVLLVDMCETERYGTYHASNEGGYISWAEFAQEIFRQAGKQVDVIPVTTEEYGLNKANRPYNSRLDKSKLTENGFEPLEDWKLAVKKYLDVLK